MKIQLRLLLSIMMFLQFFIWGAWYVTAPNYLSTIGFKAGDFAWTYSVGPIAGMISPFIIGMIADRFFAAQRVLAVMHLFGAVFMFAAASLIFAGSALATDMPAAGKAKCGACHAVDKKLMGPSYMDISAKYKGDKDAASKIAANATEGGAFGWKIGKMPPKGMGASEAEIKAMSEYIASLAK